MTLVLSLRCRTKTDQHHDACHSAAAALPDVLATAWPIITEACFLVRRRPDLVERLIEAVYEGDYELLPINASEVVEIGGWMSKYRDQQIDFADACLAYLAAREGLSTVFTVDTRHFSLFRMSNGQPLNLVPELRTA